MKNGITDAGSTADRRLGPDLLYVIFIIELGAQPVNPEFELLVTKNSGLKDINSIGLYDQIFRCAVISKNHSLLPSPPPLYWASS